MNKYRLAGVAVVTVVTTPISAYALNFDFSFTGGNNGITVAGEILGLNASGKSHATGLLIDSPNIYNEPSRYNFFTHAHIADNTFTVNNGQIVAARFSAMVLTQLVSLSFTATKYHFQTTRISEMAQGTAAVIFTPATAAAAVPEPASIALLGAGLAGISAFRRRRKPA